MTMTLREAREAAVHPDAVEFVEMVCGDLGIEAAAGVQRHCLVCDACARQLRALIGLRDLCGLEVPWTAREAVRGLAAVATCH